jgi:hypothetical protein
MDRQERLDKIAAIVCPVCNAQPNQPCDDGSGVTDYFHMGRGRIANALYGDNEHDPKMDDMRMPLSVFGPPDNEGVEVTIPIQWLVDLINCKDLAIGTLRMVLSTDSAMEFLDRTPFNVGGFYRMAEDGQHIERLEDSELEEPDFVLLGDTLRNSMDELLETDQTWEEIQNRMFRGDDD